MDDNRELRRILIVEDETVIAADLEYRLKGLGYMICGQATSGEKALELIEQHKPDLVLMDIVIKGKMDGITAAEVIRDKWGIPVIFLTAYADADRLERAKLAYPFGYILKPFQDRDLKITTEMALYTSTIEKERRKVERDLISETVWRRTLVNGSRDGIVVLDQSGKVYDTNKKFADMLGYSFEEVFDLNVWDWDTQWTREQVGLNGFAVWGSRRTLNRGLPHDILSLSGRIRFGMGPIHYLPGDERRKGCQTN